jgi:serine/threonine protein kinase
MGMCLLLPFERSTTATTNGITSVADSARNNNNNNPNNLANSFGGLNMQQQQVQRPFSPIGAGVVNNNSNNVLEVGMSRRYQRRYLVTPQGTCGKWIYMSPEILRNKEPFDGYTVDMWAAGVILFLMLTGFPPWERADLSDERFKYMSGGYLVQMMTEWETGVSSDALDLLQRMLFYDPKDRLSLDQVRAHPWMTSQT